MTATALPAPRERAAGHRRAIAPLEYSRRLWVQLTIAGTFVFLYLPIVTLIVFSFNDSRRNIVWQGFTFKYYVSAAGNTELIEAFGNSLFIALAATLISMVVGGLAGLLLVISLFSGWQGASRLRGHGEDMSAVEDAAREFVEAYGTFDFREPDA